MGRTILIVDDEQHIRLLIEQELEELLVRSAPGEGSTFWFTVPAGPA